MNNRIEELKKRSEYREKLLEQIVKTSNPIDNFRDPNNYLVLAREWNSWYPSTFQVSGGCYFFNLNEEIIIIDPGFNTLEKIIEHQLDVRLIRHIFITHFHPDHFNNLSKLLTRLPSKEHKISVYLNITSYNQFKIYMRDNTEVYELKPGNVLKLKTIQKESYFKIEVEVTKAFHKEIGGAMNSIGLKFKLRHNQVENKKYIIGFMSDTDGYHDYIEYYKKIYDDSDILIPHLGSIHSKPTGYKHLYLDGIEEFLESLNNERDRVIFLGEFGLELASDQTFYKGLTHLISPKTSYMELIRNIFKILYSESKEDSSYKSPIIFLLTKRLESIINEIEGNPFLKFEVLLPFILFNKSSLEWDKKDEIEILIKGLEEKIEFFLKKVNETNFKEVWWTVLKKFAFRVDKTDEYKKTLIKFMDDVGLGELRKNIDENCMLILPFFTNKFKEKFTFSGIIPRRGNPSSSIVSLLPSGIELEVNHFQDFKYDSEANFRSYLINDGIINFCGPNNLLRTYFSNQEIIENPKFKWFVLTFTIYFLLKALEFTNKERFNELQDGRSGICKYLQDKFRKVVIPVHDSYKIIFNKDDIRCEGYCDCNHRSMIPLMYINHNWEFFSKGGKISKEIEKIDSDKEFVNLISNNKCMKCLIDSKIEKYEEEKQKEWESIEGPDIIKEREAIIKSYEKDIKNISNLRESFYFYSKDFSNLIFGVNSEILKGSLSKLIPKTKFSPQEIILHLIHPKLIKSAVIREFVDIQLEKLTKDEVLNLICDIFSNSSPYKEIEQEPVYLYLFIDKDFSELIISKIENNINLYFLIKAVKYLNDLKEYKNNYNLKWNHLSKFIKRKAIEILYPLIENPKDYEQDYEMLKKYEDFNNWLENMGYPLDIYADFLDSNLGYKFITPRFLKSLENNSSDYKYRFLWF